MTQTDSATKKTLTPSQEEALSISKPLFVEAGAGSGKTTVLVERFLKILTTYPQLELDQIIAFTFTKKAATELLERIQKSAPDRVSENIHIANISTIHTFAGKLLRAYPLEAKLDPDFVVLDQTEAQLFQKNAIDNTLYALSKNTHPELKRFLHNHSLRQLKFYLKALFQKPPALTLDPETPEETHLLKHLYLECKKTYAALKKSHSCLDYDDLISTSVTLLTHHTHIQKQVQNHYPYIMVDEFQDTDATQWELILKLSQNLDPAKNSNLFLVGDTKQSIYAFRGSDPQVFQNGITYILEHGGSLITLADNFRTQKPVLDLLNPFFNTLFNNVYTPLVPHRPHAAGTVSLHTPHHESEAEHMAQWIKEKIAQNPELKLHDFAILLRTKSLIDTLQATFTEHKLPHILLSRPSYYQSEEIIVLFNLIKGLLNPQDNLAWKRILIDPLFFHIPETDIAELYMTFPSGHLLEKCQQTQRHPALTKAVATIQQWLHLNKLYPLHHTLNIILTENKTWHRLASQYQGQRKLQNVEMFLKKIAQYEEDPFMSSLDILDIFQNAIETNAIESESDHTFKSDHIAILSIHAAKGLEFPVVIIGECGKAFNLSKSTAHILRPLLPVDETALIEEEKRVFYVACTRARDHLHLVGKQKETQANAPSYLKFLSSFPKDSAK